MALAYVVLIILLCGSTVQVCSGLQEVAFSGKQSLKTRLPFYHSSDELRELLMDAEANCRAAQVTMDVKKVEGSDVSLDVVTIKARDGGTGSQPKKKALLVFGEHARELVSSESAVHLVRSLCGLTSVSSADVNKVLKTMDVIVVPNANPQGRKLVEAGNFCKRTNANGVDLNRNWGDEHHDGLASQQGASEVDDDDETGGEEYPGPQGFSEPETQILRGIAESLSPAMFLSVHSGAVLLGMPFGFSDTKQPPHAKEMENILKSINARHCQGSCPYGGVARTLGYPARGCSVDYAVENLRIPYAFTFEIYAGSGVMSRSTAKIADDATDSNSTSNTWSFLRKGTIQTADKIAVTVGHQKFKPADDEHCLAEFNPLDSGTLQTTLEMWTGVYLDLASQVTTKTVDPNSSTESTPKHGTPAHRGNLVAAVHPGSIAEYAALARERQHERSVTKEAVDTDTTEPEDLQPGVPSWDSFNERSPWKFIMNSNNLALPKLS